MLKASLVVRLARLCAEKVADVVDRVWLAGRLLVLMSAGWALITW